MLAVQQTQRFDPAHPPLIRVALVRLDEQCHVLAITNHHVLLDGWSTPLLVRELFTLYAAGGNPSALPKVPPYQDYLAWLAAQDREAAKVAWKHNLAGLDEPSMVSTSEITRRACS